MRKLKKHFVVVSAVWMATLTVPSFALDIAAQTSGNWESASTWAGGAVPGSSNNVYIGSTYPTGAAEAATVTLTANESANNVNVGYGSPTDGVLNLGSNKLTIAGSLNIGLFNGMGSGTLTEGGGSFATGNLTVYGSGNPFAFGASDTTSTIDIEFGSTLTTAATGNITSGGSVASATLTLGADATLSGGLNVENGATLNLGGHNLSDGDRLWLGYFGSSAVTVNRGSGGTLTIATLLMANTQNLALVSGDTITNIDIEGGSTLTTAASGNITSGGSVSSATLTLGADATLSGGLNVENGATLNLGGHNLSDGDRLWLGGLGSSAVTVNRGSGGTLTIATLLMANTQNLALVSGDTITNIDIEGGSALTTAASGNITSGGSVSSATLTLGANAAMSGGLNVENSGATLNLAGNNLSIGTLWLGYFGSSAVTVNRGSSSQGTLAVTNLDLGNSQNLSLVSGDRITNIDIETSSQLTTANSANISGGGNVLTGATLTLNASMSLTGNLNVQDNGSTLNLGGHSLSANTLSLGYNGSSAVNFNRGGSRGILALDNLDLGNGQTLPLVSGDRITNIDIETSSQLTTANSANISGGGNVLTGATLTLNAPMSLTGNLNVQDNGSTLNLGGHSLSANTLSLGYNGSSAVSFNRGGGSGGTLSLQSLDLGNGQSLTLVSGDRITGGGINGVGGTGAVNLYGGSTLSTVDSRNVTCTVNVVASTLTLGANMNIGNQSVNVANGGTVNLAGHNLAASVVLLGYDGTSTVTLNRGSGTPGTLTLGSLFLGNGQNLTLIAGDTISGGDNGVNITDGATLTTVATSNISTNTVNVKTGGTLKLGADISLTGNNHNNINIQDSGSTFDAQGHAVTANGLFFGSNGTAPVTISNLGAVTASELLEGNGTSVTLHGGDVISSEIDLEDNSVLTVDESSSGIGLTFDGTLPSSFTIDPSTMDLIFTTLASGTPDDWDFRWQDPNSSTNWINTLTTMINDDQIKLTLLPGQTYQVMDSNGYTYIDAIPETVPLPSSLAMATLCLAGLGAVRLMKRRIDIGSRPA